MIDQYLLLIAIIKNYCMRGSGIAETLCRQRSAFSAEPKAGGDTADRGLNNSDIQAAS